MTLIPSVKARTLHPAILVVAAGLGVISSFISTVASIEGIASAGKAAALVGADNELGYPSSAFAMVLFAIFLAVAVAELAGAVITPGWWTALVPVAALGVAFEIWAAYLAFSWFLVVQGLLMAIVLVVAILRRSRNVANAGLGNVLVVASVIGFFAAFRLTVDKVGTYIDPSVAPSCNFSVLVQCGTNLASWQGSLFGFPNPLLGIGGWIAALMVGVMLLAGLRFGRWFWIAFNIGVAGALALVIWLIGQSVFAISTLCPWCMTTWFVTIPVFWAVTLYNLKSGNIPLPAAGRRFFAAAYGWIPLITLVCYLVVAVLAQLRLDWIHRI
ncbi:MAG: hypothetical protein JWP05_1775 [Microbacteriaceae bacterium]|nr:hypothetical protein [Microbacteriaceae bacterium]